MTGLQLREKYADGKQFFVGRSGGINGSIIRSDIQSGNWKNQKYETNTVAKCVPNNNWFLQSKFIKLIENNKN